MSKEELIEKIKSEKSLVEFFNFKPLILKYLETQDNLPDGD
jgi:hypothetical protein